MNEQTATPVSAATESHQGEFFFLEPSRWRDGIGHGLQFGNEAALCAPGMNTVDPPTGDPAQYPERPRLLHVPGEGGLPRDFEVYASIWVVSQALKSVFETVDVVAGAHIFRQPQSGFDPVCDRAMFDALTRASLDGERLRDASAL